MHKSTGSAVGNTSELCANVYGFEFQMRHTFLSIHSYKSKTDSRILQSQSQWTKYFISILYLR